jgi:hypothetical protein
MRTITNFRFDFQSLPARIRRLRFKDDAFKVQGLCLVLVLTLLSPNLRAQRGAITLPRNLTQLTSRAATVVRGRVIYARVQAHPQYRNLSSVVVVISVEDVLKGAASQSLTFRQFIWDPRDRGDRAGYQEGQEVVLFLNRVTSAGFTSPVGMEQGRFRVLLSSTGESMVVNGANNDGLFQGTEALSATPELSSRARRMVARSPGQGGPVPLSVLTELVHTLANTGGEAR